MGLDIQELLTAVRDAVQEADVRYLETLSPEKVLAQGTARRELCGYLDQIWGALTAAGPGELDPLTRQSLAGLHAIARGLCSGTDQVTARR